VWTGQKFVLHLLPLLQGTNVLVNANEFSYYRKKVETLWVCLNSQKSIGTAVVNVLKPSNVLVKE
jgi:hypothetical protein